MEKKVDGLKKVSGKKNGQMWFQMVSEKWESEINETTAELNVSGTAWQTDELIYHWKRRWKKKQVTEANIAYQVL